MNLKTVGSRLYYIRKHAGLSRDYIEQTYNIPSITIRSWELKGPDMGVHKLSNYLNIYIKYGFNISLDALLNDKSDFIIDANSIKNSKCFLNSELCLFLLKQSPYIVFYANINEEILYLNANMRNEFEVDEKDLYNNSNLTIKSIITKFTYEQWSPFITKTLAHGSSVKLPSAESKGENPSKIISLSPDYNRSGKIIGIVATVSSPLSADTKFK